MLYILHSRVISERQKVNSIKHFRAETIYWFVNGKLFFKSNAKLVRALSLSYEYLLLFFFIYDSKLNIFGFWSDCQIKEGRCHLKLWESIIFSIIQFSVFLLTKQLIEK